MNEATTSNTCISCGTPEADPSYVETKCDNCESRLAVGWGYSIEGIHNIALKENDIRKYDIVSLENLLFRLAQAEIAGEEWRKEARIASQTAIEADDPRVAGLWRELWEALAGDVERDATWGLFIESIPGLPDLRNRTYSGTVTLRFYFDTIEVESGLSDWEVESAILDQISSDLHYNDADSVDVEYDED
jgi:hypothetical protein